MSLNKIILSIALAISFHGAAISMENEISEQINLINRFTAHTIGYDAKQIKPLGDWLTQKRKAIHDDVSWNTLINDLLGRITASSNEDIPWQDTLKLAVANSIEKIGRNFRPDIDYSHMLANHATRAVENAMDELLQANDFAIELAW